MKPRFLSSLLILPFLLLAQTVSAELKAPLTPDEMTNGKATLAPLTDLEKRIASSVGLICDKGKKPLATATWVGKEGYFITKASEVPRLNECLVKWAGSEARVREVRRDVRYDLVLGQAIRPEAPVTPLAFDPSKHLSFGQWLAAPARGQTMKIGVVSAKRRPIKGFGAAIGVRMDNHPGNAKGKGVRILGVAEESPAEAAGLQAGDIMLQLAGETVSDFRRVNEIISNRQPGEEIEVKYKRNEQNGSLRVRLASRTKVLANWDGEDFANGGISIRTDNFAEVLQHDLPLNPVDMGSPLLDLEGKAVAVNIARVDRVTTFALPTEVFWSSVQQWMEADRHPPKAVPAPKPAAQVKTEPSPSPKPGGKNGEAPTPKGTDKEAAAP